MQEYGIQIQLHVPGLIAALNRLADSNFARAGIDPPTLTSEPVAPAIPAPTKTPVDQPTADIPFEDVHKALVDLKNRKNAAAVREVLNAFDCKTVQDIPKEKFAEVLQMASAKLEG